MKKLLIITLLILSNVTFGQPTSITLSKSCPIHEFQGSIDDKYDITMFLNIDKSISGYYHYNTIQKPIILTGKKFSSGLIELYELDKKIEKKALFKGRFTKNRFQGVWINLEKNDSLKFHLVNPKNTLKNWCDYSFQLSKKIMNVNSVQVTKHCYVDMTGIECDILPPHSNKIVYENELDDNIYLIIDFSYPSIGCGGRPRGSCGSGMESGFIWLEIDASDFNIIKIQRVFKGSCLKGIYCDNLEKTFEMLYDQNSNIVSLNCDKTYNFFKNKPELGFIEID
jgi:hypothetical protein